MADETPESAPASRLHPWQRLSVRLALLLTAVTLLAVGAVGGITYKRYQRELSDTVGTQLLNIARVTALAVDPSLHARVHGQRGDARDVEELGPHGVRELPLVALVRDAAHRAYGKQRHCSEQQGQAHAQPLPGVKSGSRGALGGLVSHRRIDSPGCLPRSRQASRTSPASARV